MYKTPLSQEEQLSDLHDQYGWSMDEIEVVVALTMNEMIEIFGECCEEYDRADFWNKLSDQDKIKYYDSLGYGSNKKKFFVFLTEIKNAPGHCVLADLDNGRIEVMRHTSDFREVTEDEF
ncbi:hypothetical protein EBU91_02985 [bacterium]|nr:hypothetical protein [bacterium]